MNIRIPILALVTHTFLAAAAYAAPELSVEQGTYDFGSVAQGKKVPHTFIFKNTGDAPLQIKQIKAACGCTAASPSSSVVAPGKSGKLNVVFDSTNFSGQVQKTVDMETNAANTPTVTFAMNGTVVDQLQLTPRTLSLGSVKIGVPKEVTITANNRGSKTMRLLGVTSTSPQIKASIRKGEIKAGGSGSIVVTVTPDKEARVLSGYLHITTDNPQKRELTVPVYASPTK